MTRRRRFDVQSARDRPRRILGLSVSSDCDRLSAAMVVAVGVGTKAHAEVQAGLAVRIPSETGVLFRQLVQARSGSPDAEFASRIFGVRAQLAEIEALAVGDLLAQAKVAPAEVVALAVHDPGLWCVGTSASVGYAGLCDAARLAELTDMNVIDAFPARDVARGGQGGPITALAEWLLLRHPDRRRVLLDLGRTLRASHLPAESEVDAQSRVVSFHAGPGTRMLDQLTQRLTAREHAFDPGGRFAVQGRRVQELLAHWSADPYFNRPLPRWHPRGIPPERFLLEGVRMAVDSGWSVRDLLCTATHFVADIAEQAVYSAGLDGGPDLEVVVAGGGQQNGMLLREVMTRLKNIPVARPKDFGPCGEFLEPACIALCGLFHVDQVPSNHPAVTGTEVARVLGRLTPGSPANWRRLVAEMAPPQPSARRRVA